MQRHQAALAREVKRHFGMPSSLLYPQPRFGAVAIVLPFTPYRFTLPGHGTGETNVNNTMLAIYGARTDLALTAFGTPTHVDGERLAVGMTVWGDLKERFGDAIYKLPPLEYAKARASILRNIEFERLWPDA